MSVNGWPVPVPVPGPVPGTGELAEMRKALTDLLGLQTVAQGGQWPDGRLTDLARRVADERVRRMALDHVDAQDRVVAMGERKITSYATLLAQPRPRWVIDGLLTVGVYGLAGPPEAGKSLLCRDWICQVAAGGQNVLYALSEGNHDLADRFAAHPQIGNAGQHLAFLDTSLSLASPADVGWLIEQYQPYGVDLICFDMIYGFGLPDDEGTKGVAPALAGCKRLATELAACVLITGHPGHNTGRRFRGSSMWRGAFDGEFHMADGQLSCEKHKYTDRRQLRWSYSVNFPHLRMINDLEAAGRSMSQLAQIQEDMRLHPGESDTARAKRLAGHLGLSADYLRRHIRQARTGFSQES